MSKKSTLTLHQQNLLNHLKHNLSQNTVVPYKKGDGKAPTGKNFRIDFKVEACSGCAGCERCGN